MCSSRKNWQRRWLFLVFVPLPALRWPARSHKAQSGGSNFSLDNASGQYPVVTGILCQPGTYNGRSYSYSSYLVSDGTGSAVVYRQPDRQRAGAVGY